MTEQKNTPQEIDLIELFGKIWKGITKGFLSIIYFFFRNIKLFVLVVIFSSFIGFATYKLVKPYYKSELFGLSHTITNVELIQYINNWNYEAEFLPENRTKIKDISAKFVLDLNGDGIWDIVEDDNNETVTDTTIINRRLEGAFCIQAEIYDTSLVSTIRKRVFDYLERNKRVIEMNKIRLAQLKDLIPTIDNEIKDLDSLKSNMYFAENMKGKAGEMIVLNEKETKTFHKDILDLYQKKQDCEKELFLSPTPFEVTQNFTIPRFQENSMIKLIINYVKIGFIIGFFLILAWDQRKLLRRLFNESKI